MSSVRIVLRRLPGKFSICKLPGKDPIPDWATGPDFMAIARSKDELSIVCSAEGVPVGTQSSGGWCCLQFAGPFAFDQAGVVLSVIRPISERGIGIFIVSTFDTDYLLLQDADFVHAKALLEDVGHTVE